MKFETHLKEVIVRTHNIRSFRFPKPPSLNYLPGQFFFITLKNNGQELRKHFSFSSSPSEQNYIEFTKKLSDSDFSRKLRNLNKNDWARIDGPYGKFTFIGEHKKIALLAGGIGITPFRSMIKYCTDKKLNTEITLIYGNRSEKDIVFKKEFEELKTQNKNFKPIFIINEKNDNWKGLTGFINGDIIKKEVSDYKQRVFYVCGPPKMVESLLGIINKLGISRNNIRIEYFTGYT